MKTSVASLCLAAGIFSVLAISCNKNTATSALPEPPAEVQSSATLSLRQVARMFASLPLGPEQLQEVYDAVGSSSDNGYDEEYTMASLFTAPGTGVGESTKASKSYGTSLRDMIADYLSQTTRADGLSPEEYMNALSESDLQLYWPYSENWDGEMFPIITFDPGYGSQYNNGYQLELQPDGSLNVTEVYVDEYVAMDRPVWVVNNNTDSGYTTLELLKAAQPSSTGPASQERKSGSRNLILERFKMLRNYDTWFGGASEFWVKCGSVSGFTASTEAELKLFSPTVTDFLIVVKRSQKDQWICIDNILLSGFTNQLENLVFMITEDDGGTKTSWKCEATVKIKSRSYGFEIDLPYNRKDDIVWRGQLAASYFQSEDKVTGRFGDVEVTFALE